jgi:hypothetical protein
MIAASVHQNYFYNFLLTEPYINYACLKQYDVMLVKPLKFTLWCKYCVHMFVNGKMRPIETIPGMGGGEGERWRG